MNKGNNIDAKKLGKKKMNTYLKYTLILLVSGCLGGVFGFATAMGDRAGMREIISAGMTAALLFVRSNFILLECICGVICIAICEACFYKMKKLAHEMSEAEDELVDSLEYKLEKFAGTGVVTSTAGTILMILFIAPGYSIDYIRSQSTEQSWIYLAGMVLFMGMVAYLNFWQIRYVKLLQRIYPEKKGDPASVKFQEQWLNSCDEAEKECIYQASYKTYTLLGKVLPICTLGAMLLHMVWNTGILAIVISAFLWLLTTANYCRCCVVKKGEKLA